MNTQTITPEAEAVLETLSQGGKLTLYFIKMRVVVNEGTLGQDYSTIEIFTCLRDMRCIERTQQKNEGTQSRPYSIICASTIFQISDTGRRVVDEIKKN